MQRWLWDGIFWHPRSPSRRLGMEIFHFGLDRKFPRIWNPGDRDRRFWIPKNPQWEIPIPGIGFWDFLDRKSGVFMPEYWGFLKIWGFLSPGFFATGIFRGWGFSRWMANPTKEPPLFICSQLCLSHDLLNSIRFIV